jgi:hypothetical protein
MHRRRARQYHAYRVASASRQKFVTSFYVEAGERNVGSKTSCSLDSSTSITTLEIGIRKDIQL